MSQNKVMLINVTHSEESRVAILEDGVLEEFEIETFDQRSCKGNIYKGKVESVHQGLQAAFVDIGNERSAFLPLDEINFKVYPSRKEGARGRIENHLSRGQEVLVQVVRDAFATKPPTLSTYYSLPGRYLVLTPFADSAGVSRKLEEKQRDRIRKILSDLKPPEPHGIIARTAVAAATKLEMHRDLKYLTRLWERIEQASKKVRPPALVYEERSLVIRALRDLYTPEVKEILVDDPHKFEEIMDFFEVVAPHKKNSVKLYEGKRPLFNKYNLEEQIEHIFRRRVPLPSGGAVIFDPTEALVAIDVNSGKMKKEGHIEETATKCNLEAVEEVSKQIRLRDLGGLLVIDFIDMRASKNVRAVEKAMRDALKKDKARHDVTRLSRLGLMEISRERIGKQKASLRYVDCDTCGGTGSIKTVEAAAMQALRKLQTRVVRGDLQLIEVLLPSDVAEYMLNHKRDQLAGWEERYATRIIVRGESDLGRDDSEIHTEVRERGTTERGPVVEHGEVLAGLPSDAELEEEAAAAGSSDDDDEEGAGTGKKKRRRRRRGGRRHRKRNGEAQTDADADETNGESRDDSNGHTEEGEIAAQDGSQDEETNGESRTNGRRRRRRRGGRGRRPAKGDAAVAREDTQDVDPGSLPPLAATSVDPSDGEEDAPRMEWWKRLIGVS